MSLTLLNLDRRSVSPEIGGGGGPERRSSARSGDCSADLREQTADAVEVESLGVEASTGPGLRVLVIRVRGVTEHVE
jgi:hypothetical protein